MDMKPILYIMVGIPGSGKSTAAKEIQQTNPNKIKIISRDKIRFSMISSDKNYFKREKQVYKEFIKQILEAGNAGYDVIADATHINEKSRQKILNHIIDREGHSPFATYYFIVIDTPLEQCLINNKKRTGLEHVPESRIREMYSIFTYPKTSCVNLNNILKK